MLKDTQSEIEFLCFSDQLYNTNIDQKLRNKLHGPLHYKIGVTCVYRVHLSNPPISKFSRHC